MRRLQLHLSVGQSRFRQVMMIWFIRGVMTYDRADNFLSDSDGRLGSTSRSSHAGCSGSVTRATRATSPHDRDGGCCGRGRVDSRIRALWSYALTTWSRGGSNGLAKHQQMKESKDIEQHTRILVKVEVWKIVVVTTVVEDPVPSVYVNVVFLTIVEGALEPAPEPAGMVVLTGTTVDVTIVDSAGQLVTVGAQLVIVMTLVERNVEVTMAAGAVSFPKPMSRRWNRA